MIETISALLIAHMVADFVLQTNWIIANKRRLNAFALHIAIVTATAVLAMGAFNLNADLWAAIAIVVISHASLDAIKTFVLKPAWLEKPHWAFGAFSLDQLGHLGFIMLAGVTVPHAFDQGEWAWRLGENSTLLVQIYLVLAGLIAATRMGEFGIDIFLKRFALPDLEGRATSPAPVKPPDRGLPAGGAWIGLLERAVIFCLILMGQFSAIGFLLAAKSVLRFQYAHERSQSEYVIIGTLTSFTWAALIAVLIEWILKLVSS